tara:strand:+ start:250461 stop:252788 length:2328 start_codon:yes stop_codon:yes gene_type:complete
MAIDKPNKPIKMQLPSKDAMSKVAVAKGHTVQKTGTPTPASLQNASGNVFANAPLAHGTVVNMPLTKAAQSIGGGLGVTVTQPMFFSPLHTPQNWQIASKRREVYQWARFYYENEPKVAAGIDFYSQFPINGFKLECKRKTVLKFFERLVDKLDLLKWLRLISHERFLLGDVFIFTEIDSPDSRGETGLPPDEWTHADGTIKRIIVMNPDWMEVSTNILADDPEIVMLPDEELKKVVMQKQPRHIYDRLPDEVKALVAAGRPIRLSSTVTSHLKHGGAPYGTYGDSILRRMFTTLAYKTKLMTANWIVAERLILPVRVVKIGEKDRPASEDDIADISQQLAAVANDPNLTIVTHHAFDYEWYGATGKIHNINAELEYVGKEILDGLMLNQALLNGEGTSYASGQIGAEALIMRLETWRSELKEWVEKRIFLPIAKMQGFIDEEESKLAGETVFLYPRIKWEDMRLRDNSNLQQMFIQLNQTGKISDRTLLEQFDLNYDQEVERIREEQVQAMQDGQLMPGMGDPMAGGGGAPMPGGMGGMGAPGGGAAGGPPGADPMGGGMDPMGDGMGGGAPMAPPGAAPPGGGMAAAADAASPGKVYKKGKAPKSEGPSEEELAAQQPVTIQLTGPEAKLFRAMRDMRLPHAVYAQFKQYRPGNQQPYVMDFAIPELRLDIEADGDKWHTEFDDKQRDQRRDMDLAHMGWSVLRFSESAINENIDQVEQILQQNISELVKEHKNLKKSASVGEVELQIEVKTSESLSDDIANGYTSISVVKPK